MWPQSKWANFGQSHIFSSKGFPHFLPQHITSLPSTRPCTAWLCSCPSSPLPSLLSASDCSKFYSVFPLKRLICSYLDPPAFKSWALGSAKYSCLVDWVITPGTGSCDSCLKIIVVMLLPDILRTFPRHKGPKCPLHLFLSTTGSRLFLSYYHCPFSPPCLYLVTWILTET